MEKQCSFICKLITYICKIIRTLYAPFFRILARSYRYIQIFNIVYPAHMLYLHYADIWWWIFGWKYIYCINICRYVAEYVQIVVSLYYSKECEMKKKRLENSTKMFYYVWHDKATAAHSEHGTRSALVVVYTLCTRQISIGMQI